MKLDVDTWGPATLLIIVLVVCGAVTGAVMCITNPDVLSFGEYMAAMVGFAGSLGLLSVGRGIRLQNTAPAAQRARRARRED